MSLIRRGDCAFPTAITSRSRILLLDRPPLPALSSSQGSPRELSLLQGWCLFSPRGVVLFVLFVFGGESRPSGAKRAIPPGIDRRHGTFSWVSAMLLLLQLVFLALRLACPPWHSDKAFWIHLDGYKHITSCGELPSEWLQILFVLERVLIGPDVQVDSTPSRASGYQLFCCA
jgi:hypothetical protein